MKIINEPNTQKKEDINIIPFLEFLYQHEHGNLHIKPVKEKTGISTPDYFASEKSLLVEVKQIIDNRDLSGHVQWSRVASNLQKAVNNNSKMSKVKGSYLVNTSPMIKTREFSEIAEGILSELTAGKTGKINVARHDFEINKVSEQANIVVFGTFGPASFIDPASTIYVNVNDKIPKINEQLAFTNEKIKPTKRILLLVNEYHALLYDWDLFKALSRMYDLLLQSQNIDEIWIQYRIKAGGFKHKLIYRKSFFESFEQKNILNYDDLDLEIFADWFSSLADLGDEKKEKLYEALTVFIDKKKPDEQFTNTNNRYEIIRLGLWLLETNKIKEAIWLIKKFKDDNDPPEPDKYNDREELNYHKQIFEGKDVNVITTVQGHLAWVVKELVRKSSKDDITNLLEGFKLAKEKLSMPNQNLYIILEWLFPLIEISNRRIWIANKDPETYKEFRSLILDPTDGLIARYSTYKEIAKNLFTVFYYVKDLTENESTFVLENLINIHEVASLLVYYALFREGHYKKGQEAGDIFGKITPEIFHYSSNKANQLLEKVITNSSYTYLRNQIAWQYYQILREVPGEFCRLVSYIDKLFTLPFDRELYSKLELILEDWYGKTSTCDNPSHQWLMTYIQKASDYSKSYPSEQVDLWITIDDLLSKVAEFHAEDLKTLLLNLYEIWMKNGYIGEFNVIFSAYKFIRDPEVKADILKVSKDIYSKMKAVKPTIKEILFDE